MLPHFADCWHPGECARCPSRAQHPPFPSTEVPGSCHFVLPRNLPPAQVAGAYTEKRNYGELLNQDGWSEDLYSLLGNLFSDSMKQFAEAEGMTSSKGSALQGGIKGLGAWDTDCGLEQNLWCPMRKTFWVVIIFWFILWEHQRDWNTSQTHCAHGKAPLWTTNLLWIRGPSLTLLLCSTFRVIWTWYFWLGKSFNFLSASPHLSAFCAQGAPTPGQGSAGRNLWALSLSSCHRALQQGKKMHLFRFIWH